MGLIWAGATAVVSILPPGEHWLIWVVSELPVIVLPHVGRGGPLWRNRTPVLRGGPGMGPAGGQLGPAAPLQLGEEASDWLPSGGGGSGELLACLLLGIVALWRGWHCGTVAHVPQC